MTALLINVCILLQMCWKALAVDHRNSSVVCGAPLLFVDMVYCCVCAVYYLTANAFTETQGLMLLVLSNYYSHLRYKFVFT